MPSILGGREAGSLKQPEAEAECHIEVNHVSEQAERKQINFTIVPDEQPGEPRTYANFCSIAHTPFDFTLTFCEVMPLSDKEVREAEKDHVVRAPVRSRVVVPVQFVPNLIAALQEHMRVFSETYSNVGWTKGGPIH
jgi:hypothetical protein